jgi:hypothetical protein
MYTDLAKVQCCRRVRDAVGKTRQQRRLYGTHIGSDCLDRSLGLSSGTACSTPSRRQPAIATLLAWLPLRWYTSPSPCSSPRPLCGPGPERKGVLPPSGLHHLAQLVPLRRFEARGVHAEQAFRALNRSHNGLSTATNRRPGLRLSDVFTT